MISRPLSCSSGDPDILGQTHSCTLMEEYDVISLQTLIGTATDGSLQGLYGRLLSPLTKSSSLVEVHARHGHM